MIPRSASKLKKTSCSVTAKKALSQKGYASSSKPARAAALAMNPSSSSQYSYKQLPPSPFSTQYSNPFVFSDVDLTPHLTVFPPPMAPHLWKTSEEGRFMTSSTQDRLISIDACLLNQLDVVRAKNIFESLRREDMPERVMNAVLFNKMFLGYLERATSGKGQSQQWFDDAWTLYADMVEGRSEEVAGSSRAPVKIQICSAEPDATTYHYALKYLRDYPDECLQSGSTVDQVLADIEAYMHHIPLADIISRGGRATLDEAAALADYLATTAERAGRAGIVTEVKKYRATASLPDVKPVVTQKARGKDSAVPLNISDMRNSLNEIVEIGAENVDDADRQLRIEETVHETAHERFKREADMMRKAGVINNPTLKVWVWQWSQALKVKLSQEIALLKEKPAEAATVLPFIENIKPDKLALITVMEMVSMQYTGDHERGGLKVARCLMDIARAVEAEYQTQLLRKYHVDVTKYPKSLQHRSPASPKNMKDIIDRRVDAQKAYDAARTVADSVLEWTAGTRLKVGSLCVDALMSVATIEARTPDGLHSENQPAFQYGYEHIRGYKHGVIRCNPYVQDALAKDSMGDVIHPRLLPMVVPPRPWLDYKVGGYLSSKSNSRAIRIKECPEQLLYFREAAKSGAIDHIFRGLDVLGSTPWAINKEVFDVVLQVWNSGEAFADIPPTSAKTGEGELEKPGEDASFKAKTEYQRQVLERATTLKNNHSQRCSVNYKVDIARAFLNEERFYFPHNVDFRGRAYPIPPHLSHIGDDLSRGLLKFADKKPLGEKGLLWLKIHLANVYGYDKASLDDRVAFAEKHLEDIYDSAERPLDGKRWWLSAGDPWQTLATCMELRAALESPNPQMFESNLPVHQDGTCNGLQHYAALGGDAAGAAQVNLDVNDKPSDVYSFVANMVEEEITKDIANGRDDLKILSGKVSRKVVKQTVMTTVYGVTAIGARAQIERQLEDRGDIPREKTWGFAIYLASKVLSCIGDLFKGANDIQDWLTHAARFITRAIPDRSIDGLERKPEDPEPKEEKQETEEPAEADVAKSFSERATQLKRQQMTSVIWTTPLGLPVVQPYRKKVRKQVRSGSQTVYISDPNANHTVSAQKQASAFPPNFIHSLDATHMLMTASTMAEAGLTFASVHDSYWTHACDIDVMSRFIRDTFVRLHSLDVLEKLEQEFRERYANYVVPIHLLGQDDFARIAQRTDLTDEFKQQLLNIAKRRFKKLDNKATEASLRENAVNDEGLFVPSPRYSTTKTGNSGDKSPADRNMFFIPLTALLPQRPKKGSFDIKTTMKSTYFFN